MSPTAGHRHQLQVSGPDPQGQRAQGQQQPQQPPPPQQPRQQPRQQPAPHGAAQGARPPSPTQGMLPPPHRSSTTLLPPTLLLRGAGPGAGRRRAPAGAAPGRALPPPPHLPPPPGGRAGDSAAAGCLSCLRSARFRGWCAPGPNLSPLRGSRGVSAARGLRSSQGGGKAASAAERGGRPALDPNPLKAVFLAGWSASGSHWREEGDEDSCAWWEGGRERGGSHSHSYTQLNPL